ncbi:hypothetical protein ccbrp13_21450 [Ktedonobacteria bacterium brp13]|nr:hypothetical protein ccbrp13_21450 [Ktedonobacteria bacterium brp13]
MQEAKYPFTATKNQEVKAPGQEPRTILAADTRDDVQAIVAEKWNEPINLVHPTNCATSDSEDSEQEQKCASVKGTNETFP